MKELIYHLIAIKNVDISYATV